jgi:putative transcriptional regulator
LGVPGKPPKPNPPADLQGKLLLADPSLRDGTFDKSVILLTHHSTVEGAHGLILNHPTGRVVGDFLTAEEFAALRHLPVHEGGPVSRDQLTLSSFWWSRKLGLRWAVRISASEAADHAHRPGRIVRAFIGYSGWSSGQLEGEMRRQSWFAVGPEPDLLGSAHDQALWTALMGRISPLHRVLAQAPDHPQLN